MGPQASILAAGFLLESFDGGDRYTHRDAGPALEHRDVWTGLNLDERLGCMRNKNMSRKRKFSIGPFVGLMDQRRRRILLSLPRSQSRSRARPRP